MSASNFIFRGNIYIRDTRYEMPKVILEFWFLYLSWVIYVDQKQTANIQC